MRLVRFRVESVDDSGPFQKVTGRGEGGEILRDIYRPQPDGLSTIPKAGALGVALFDGSRERGIVQGLEHADERPAGETGKLVYGPGGQRFRLKPSGEVQLEAPGGLQMAGAAGPTVKTVGDKLYLGGDPDAGHVFAKVMTESGASPFVFARIA